MIGLVEIFLIAVSLALDAFAVSVSSGISVPGFGWKQAVRMGLYFGFFQFAMPLIGWFLGTSVSGYIEALDHWVAFALLAVIGGLLDDQKTYNQSEVPGLGSIPVLGWLFKSRNKKSTQTNLFIFITPKVIRNAADSADLTREKQLVLHETSVGHDGLGLPIMSKPKLLKPVFVN